MYGEKEATNFVKDRNAKFRFTYESYEEMIDFLRRVAFRYALNKSVKSSKRGLANTMISKAGLEGVALSILGRTLQFQKIVEWIYPRQIQRGFPAFGINPVNLSLGTIGHALRTLYDVGLIIKGPIPGSLYHFMGLNLPEIYTVVYGEYFERVELRSSMILDDHRLFQKTYAAIKAQNGAFEELSILTIPTHQGRGEPSKKDTPRNANEELREKGRPHLRLVESIEQTKAKVKEKEKEKLMAKGSQSFLTPRGEIAALDFWHSCVLDTEKYSGYHAVSTKVMRGMMHNFLKECEENQMTDLDIRKKIVYTVDRWDLLSGRGFTYYGMTKAGSGYTKEITIEGEPRFDVFFTYRTYIFELLEGYATDDTEPPDSGTGWAFSTVR